MGREIGVLGMRRPLTLGIAALLLAGCAVPLPVQVASWALDGLSYLTTQKSVADHGLSIVAQQDCAVWRGLTEGRICQEYDDAATMIASAEPVEPARFAPSVGDRDDEATEFAAAPIVQDLHDDLGDFQDIEALNEFETAAGGPETEDEIALEALEPAETAAPRPTESEAIEIVLLPDPRLTVVEPSEPQPSPLLMSPPQAVERESRTVIGGFPIPPLKPTVGEPASGIYFVIGSFRNHANARSLVGEHRELLPTILAANLDGGAVYRVVVGPVEQGAETTVHRSLSKAGIADTWAIRVTPGDWLVAMTIFEAKAALQRSNLLAGLPE